MKFDVVVSGGGPSGLACAIHFSRMGLRVLLAERRNFPQDKCCGEFLHPTAVRELTNLGVDIENICSIDRVWLAAGRRKVEFPIHPDARSLSRRELSKRLLRTADRAGAQIQSDISLDDVNPGPHEVQFRLGRHLLSTKLLIVAEGASSSTGRRLGLTRRTSTIVYGFSIRFQSSAVQRHVALGALDDGYVGLCDLGNGWTNLACILRPAAYRRLNPHQPGIFERLKVELPAWSDWLSASPAEIFYQAPVCVSLTGDPRNMSNVWMVGDSAGMRETAFGDGIARSLRQASQAAKSFLETEGNLQAGGRLYANRIFKDAHRACRPSLALAGTALRKPYVTDTLLKFFRPLIQKLCLGATTPAGDSALR